MRTAPTLLLAAVVLGTGCASATPALRPPGFVAIYRWSVKSGCEASVQSAWRLEAERYRARYGSCGARLHREEDGTFVSTAFWASRAAWAAAPRPIDLPSAESTLNACIVAKVEELHLTPVEDVAAPTCP
jgi:hypothetical protein